MAAHKKVRVLRMLFCDFCGQSQDICALLIKGRDEVHICDRCVSVCVEILAEHRDKARPTVEGPPAADAVDPVGEKVTKDVGA